MVLEGSGGTALISFTSAAGRARAAAVTALAGVRGPLGGQ